MNLRVTYIVKVAWNVRVFTHQPNLETDKTDQNASEDTCRFTINNEEWYIERHNRITIPERD